MVRGSLLGLAAIGAAAVLAGAAGAGSHSNSTSITITDCCTDPSGVSPASVYPSSIVVSGETGTVSGVTATLSGLNHTSTDDVDVLLSSPNGKAIVLMSDAGGFTTATNRTITFSDSGSTDVPDSTALASTTYKPHNWGSSPGPLCDGVEPDPDVFPSAPAGPYVSTLAGLNSQTPNGTWSLYVVDDCAGDSGSITGGWSVNLTTAPTAVELRKFEAVPSRRAVTVRWRTGSEAAVLGFNVFRTERGRLVRLNRSLIRAKAGGTVADGRYRLVDRAIRPGRSYTYRLQVVQLDGTRSFAATAGVRVAG